MIEQESADDNVFHIDSSPKLTKISFVFRQGCLSLGTNQALSIETELSILDDIPPRYTIKTDGWEFRDEDDLTNLFSSVRASVDRARNSPNRLKRYE